MGHGLHDSAQSGGWDLSVPTLDHLTHSIMYKHILSLYKEKHGLTLVKYYKELSENFLKNGISHIQLNIHTLTQNAKDSLPSKFIILKSYLVIPLLLEVYNIIPVSGP